MFILSPKMDSWWKTILKINKSTNLIIMGEFSVKHFNLVPHETNHYRTKLMNAWNSYNLFVLQNNYHTRYESLRDKRDTKDH